MKDKIITLIIGILIGAIITAAIFLIFKPKSSRTTPDFSKFSENGEGFDFSQRRNRNSENSDDEKIEESTKTEDTKDETKE